MAKSRYKRTVYTFQSLHPQRDLGIWPGPQVRASKLRQTITQKMHADQWLLQASKPADFANAFSASLLLQHTLHYVRLKKADCLSNQAACPIKSEQK